MHDNSFAKTEKAIIVLTPIDAALIRVKNQESKAKQPFGSSGRVEIAVPDSVLVTPETHGFWTPVKEGKVWRLEIQAKGSTDLNLGFTSYSLPEGATLHIYDKARTYYQGPYTQKHNHASQQLWTPVIPGDSAIVELFLPSNPQGMYGKYSLTLTHVGKGYQQLFDEGLSAILKQGSCNIDVICSEADDWREQVRSVAALIINGSGLCTGTLVNNVREDQTPYLLTAQHCNISSSLAPTVVAYWNYESSSCGALSGGSLAQNTSGSTLRAEDTFNDMTLLELNQPVDSNYRPFFAGWDARTSLQPATTAGIHHPRGDEKAFSFNDDSLTTGPSCIVGGGANNTHWYVDNWEIGTTEPGSSGSGLFDGATKRLIGYLSGGAASCSNRSAGDCYGKLSVGWELGVKEFLDPGNSGNLFIDGLDGSNGFALPTSSGSLSSEVDRLQLDYTAPATLFFVLDHLGGQLVANTEGSDFDTHIGLYNRSGVLISENNDSNGVSTSEIRTEVAVGQYYLAVTAADGSFESDFSVTSNSSAFHGNLVINFRSEPPSTEDILSSTNPIGNRLYSSPASYFYEIAHLGGELTLSTQGSAFDTELGLFNSSGELVAQNDDSPLGGLSSLLVQTLPQGTYYVAVSAFNAIFSNGFGVLTTSTTENNSSLIITYTAIDQDSDGVPDSNDNCPSISNANQANNDGDAEGDACDNDDDNDGINDVDDNCHFTANPSQEDEDQDGIGNACPENATMCFPIVTKNNSVAMLCI